MDPISIALGLAQFAPSLLRFFGAGEKSTTIAEKVIGIAQTVTGAPTGEAALVTLQQNAQVAHEFSLAALRADTELEQAYLSDRKDARARDVALAQAGRINKRADLMVLMDVIGLALGFIAMLALGYVKARYPSAISEGVFGALLAQLSTITSYFGLCLRDAHQFEFGSSRGSRDKDELLAKAPPIKG
jgi:hypothetical protein